RVAGLKVAILGDIRHSRVARSNALLLELLGAEVWLSGPAAALPPAGAFGGARVTLNRDEALEGADVVMALRDRDEALEGADVVMALRVQRERQARGLLPPPGAYRSRWGLDARDLERCSPDVVLLHPGPVNRDVEVDGRLLEDPRCAVLQQVANGVAVRMAVLHTLLGQGGGRSWSTCSSAAGC